MRSIWQKSRGVAAIVLLCTVFLPLGECSRHENNLAPPQKSFSQQLFPQDNADFAYQYAYRVVHLSTLQAGVFALVALLWPLAALGLDRKVRGRRFAWILYGIELLLCAGSIYWLYAFTAMGRWLYGAYVVFAAVVAFGITTLLLIVDHVRTRPSKGP
jgi:hypothetical protein